MSAGLLLLPLSSNPNSCSNYVPSTPFCYFDFSRRFQKRHRLFRERWLSCLGTRSTPDVTVSNSLETTPQLDKSRFKSLSQSTESPILLDVAGMMCGGCVSRVKSVLSSDDRVESAVVNMLTDTAAVRLKPEAVEGEVTAHVAESLARRLTECGFETKTRTSGVGVEENVKKWKESVKKKEELLVKSRNRVAFAWTLVALCCGSHASHILHSLGIHIAHGNFGL